MSVSSNLVAASEMFLSSKRKRQSPMWCSSGCAFDISHDLDPPLFVQQNMSHLPKRSNSYADVCVSKIGRCHIFLSSKEYVQPLMRWSPGSAVDTELPSSFLSYSLAAVPSTIKTTHRVLHVWILQNDESSCFMLASPLRNATRSLARARLFRSPNPYKYHLKRCFLLKQRFPHLLETKRLTNNVCVPESLRIRRDVLLSSKITSAGPSCTRDL